MTELELQKLFFLKRIELFRNLPVEILNQIAVLTSSECFGEDEYIFSAGDLGSTMFVILNGVVRLESHDSMIMRLKEEDIFGELALFSDEPRAADAIAEKDCELILFDQDLLFELISEDIDVLRQFIRFLLDRYSKDILESTLEFDIVT